MLLLSVINLFYATSITLLFAPSPMALGALILVMALQLSLILGMTTSSWFAMLLFLIYIGGLLVMFSYFIALCPNLPIPMNSPVIVFLSALIICQGMLFLSPPSLGFWKLSTTTAPTITATLTQSNIPLLLFLASILFFALILVVKLSSRTAGPLRPFAPPF